MEVELRKYEKYARDIKRLLIVSGVWPNYYPIVETLIAYFALCTTAMTFMGALNFCLHHITNVMIVTKGMGLVFSLLSTFMKITIFLYHRDDVKSLNRHLTARFTSDLQNIQYRSAALAHFSAFSNLFYTLTTIVGVASFLTSVLIPALALRQGKYVPVCPSLFPFKYRPGDLIFWLLQAVEAAAAFFVWSVTCGVDSAFGMYTLQVCGELRVLSRKFESLNSSQNYKEDLKECIERHHMLMKSRDTLQKLFGILTIYLAITSAIIQCTLIFQATEVVKTKSPFKIGYLICFIGLKLVQAFMYAWYGNLIAEESESCLDSMYNAAWPGSGDSRFMKDVLVVLSQRPLTFTAKGCMLVKMEMFSKIVNTSVSYFFLLQTLDEASQN